MRLFGLSLSLGLKRSTLSRTLCGASPQEIQKQRYKTFRPEDPQPDPPPPPQIRKVACAVIRRDSEPRLSVHVRTDASLSMPRGTKQVQGLTGPPLGLAFCFQFADTGRPWTAARARSSLTSVRAGRSQSHIKLSENPKVPVRSVNSSIVPPTLTQRDRCNKAPPPVVQPPPAGPTGTVTPFSST